MLAADALNAGGLNDVLLSNSVRAEHGTFDFGQSSYYDALRVSIEHCGDSGRALASLREYLETANRTL